jgi:hypothetical protein
VPTECTFSTLEGEKTGSAKRELESRASSGGGGEGGINERAKSDDIDSPVVTLSKKDLAI